MAKDFKDLDKNDQLLLWQQTKDELASAREHERAMREHIVNSGSHGIRKDAFGTQSINLGAGWTIRATINKTYKVINDKEKIEKSLGGLDNWIAERLINWTPTLDVTMYNQLTKADKKKVEDILIVGRSAPILKIINLNE